MVRMMTGIALLVLSNAHMVQSANADGSQVLLKETFDSSSDNSGFAAKGIGGPDTRIQYFLFSTFHGGNKPKWTPLDEKGKPSTVHALFDNFMVAEGIQSGETPSDGAAGLKQRFPGIRLDFPLSDLAAI